MKWLFGGALIFLLFTFSQGFSISTSDVRDIMDKDIASVEDAVMMLSSLDNPDVEKDSVDLKGNGRLMSLKMEDPLNAGRFSIIAIEMKKVRGGIIYSLTGFSKYAAESLIYQNILPSYYFWNRNISGMELIEFVSLIKEKQK